MNKNWDELSALDLPGDCAEVLVPDAVWREVAHCVRPGAMSHSGVMLRRISSLLAVSPELEALAQVFSLHTGSYLWNPSRGRNGTLLHLLAAGFTSAGNADAFRRIPLAGHASRRQAFPA